MTTRINIELPTEVHANAKSQAARLKIKLKTYIVNAIIKYNKIPIKINGGK